MKDGPFILPLQPSADDTRERNSFGYLKEFGKAYSRYYTQLETQDNDNETKNRSPSHSVRGNPS
jgi:hypothetical protein